MNAIATDIITVPALVTRVSPTAAEVTILTETGDLPIGVGIGSVIALSSGMRGTITRHHRDAWGQHCELTGAFGEPHCPGPIAAVEDITIERAVRSELHRQ